MSNRRKRRQMSLNAEARARRAATPTGLVAVASALFSISEGASPKLDKLVLMDELYFNLLKARTRLAAVTEHSNDLGEQAAASARLLTVQADLALHKARRLVIDGLPVVTPPTNADRMAVAANSAGIAQAIAGSAKVSAVIGLMADALALGQQLAT